MLFEALVTSATWTGLLKWLTGRERPRETGGETADWTGPGGIFDHEENREAKPRSFPSGHSSGAWSAATILAHQYPAHNIVPVIAYATAAGIAYSRMVVGAHWLSDVVAGSFLGYVCAQQVVSAHRQRRLQDEDPRLQFGAEIRGSYKGFRVEYRF